MKRVLILIILGLLIFSVGIIAQKSPQEINLHEGKNNITLNFSEESTFASDIIKSYPEIDAITLINGTNLPDKRGYVNVFGGIGEDFILKNNQTYEIISKLNTTIMIK